MKRFLLLALLTLLLGACATTGGVGVPTDPNLIARIGGFAVCQQLGPASLARVNAAGALLTGGKSILGEIETALLSGLSPKNAALAAFIIDTGGLASVLPNLGTPIAPDSPAGQQIGAAFAGCRLGAVSVQAKTESAEGTDLSLALARYRAAQYFAAHPEAAR